ncbi:MAG: hypothetical protein EF807_08970 [Candidatus Methanolliviera hydrocarbonicum]|uniref:Acyl-CoA dehydrogenase n=1 Tax=Candidatus Methanolliviera hydrocarbonicum TaxID=2491085 RepID=A0A520KUQ6_9EURY|nr:MAG: hypothetical protein EF807_08970 [Candidatus Methanolliviera hydrocarbonicum]
MKEEEIKTLRDSVREFAIKELPRDIVLEIDMPKTPFPWGIIKKGGELGYLSMVLPERDGGQELDLEGFSVVLEEFAKGSAGVANIFLVHNVAQIPLMSLTDRRMRDQFLTPLVESMRSDRPKLATIIFPQPDISLKSERDRYIISGRADFVFNARNVDLFTMFIETDGEVRCFAVPTDTEGIVVKEVYALGLRASPMALVEFNNVELIEDNLVATSKEVLEESLIYTNIGVASLALGVAETGYRYALDYAKQRYQAGTEIINHRHIRRMLGDMFVGIETARSVISRACKEGGNGYLSDVARISSADMAMSAATDAVQVHGGYGYMHDTGVEILMRDAEYCQVYPDSTIRRKIDIIAEEAGADKKIYI